MSTEQQPKQLTVKEALEQGNRLIAEFHGWKHFSTPKQKGKGYWDFPEWGKASWDAYSFEYHKSWDWLMPVVEKINSMRGYDVIIFKTSCHVNHEHTILFETSYETSKKGSLIMDVWQVIVDFIQWYNTQKQ